MKRSLFWIAALLQAIYFVPYFIQIGATLTRTSLLIMNLRGQIHHSNTGIANAQTHAILIAVIFRVVVFYLFYLLLFPRFLYQKRIKEFIIYTLLAIFISSILQTWIFRLTVQRIAWYMYGPDYMVQVINFATGVILVGMIACVMRGFISWIADINYRKALERKNLKTSLALLKAQINPHFLFNTLNNIDVLIEKDPVTASVYLKKLSDILRFTLYESLSENITLRHEVEYIREYIELQQLRTANTDFVKFEVSGDQDRTMIAPMLFIPFIENAFKHSTNKKINNAITITLSADTDEVRFCCSNVYDEHGITTQEKSGLGLELANSRLALLYGNNYMLDIDKASDRFTIHLVINLHGH